MPLQKSLIDRIPVIDEPAAGPAPKSLIDKIPVIEERSSPATGNYEKDIYDTVKEQGYNDNVAKLLVAQAKHESGNFTSPVFKNSGNPYGMTYGGQKGAKRSDSSQPASEGGTSYAGYANAKEATSDVLGWLKRREQEGKINFDTDFSTPETYAKALKRGGYYTAPTSEYIGGLSRYLDSSESAQQAPTDKLTWDGGMPGEIGPAPTQGVSAGTSRAMSGMPLPATPTQPVKTGIVSARDYVSADATNFIKSLPPQALDVVSKAVGEDPQLFIKQAVSPAGGEKELSQYYKLKTDIANQQYEDKKVKLEQTRRELASPVSSSSQVLPADRITAIGDVNEQLRALNDEHAGAMQQVNNSVYNIAAIKAVAGPLQDQTDKQYAIETLDPLAVGEKVLQVMGAPLVAYGDPNPDPIKKAQQEIAGYQAMQSVMADAIESGDTETANALKEKTKNYSQKVLDNNPAFRKKVFADAISRKIDESANTAKNFLLGTSVDKFYVDKVARGMGLRPQDYADIQPEDIYQDPGVGGKFFATLVKPIISAEQGLQNVFAGDKDQAFTKSWNDSYIGKVLGLNKTEENSAGFVNATSQLDVDPNSPTYGQPIAAEQKAKYNPGWNTIGSQVVEGIGTLLPMVTGQGLASQGLQTLGAGAKASDAIGLGIYTFITGYDQNYQKAKQAIGLAPGKEAERVGMAMLYNTIETGAMQVLPAKAIADKWMGTSAGKELTELVAKKGIDNVTAAMARPYIVDGLKEGFKDLGKAVSIGVINQLGDNAADAAFAPEKYKNTDVIGDLEQNVITGAISMLIPTMGGGIMHARNSGPMYKNAMYEIGTNPKPFVEDVQRRIAAGEFTPEVGAERIRAINSISDIYKRDVPAVSVVNGETLNQTQQKDYGANVVAEKNLQAQEQAVTDPVQKKAVQDQIAELQAERARILQDGSLIDNPAYSQIRAGLIEQELAGGEKIDQKTYAKVTKRVREMIGNGDKTETIIKNINEEFGFNISPKEGLDLPLKTKNNGKEQEGIAARNGQDQDQTGPNKGGQRIGNERQEEPNGAGRQGGNEDGQVLKEEPIGIERVDHPSNPYGFVNEGENGEVVPIVFEEVPAANVRAVPEEVPVVPSPEVAIQEPVAEAPPVPLPENASATEKNRAAGQYEKDGIVYKRNEIQAGPTGNTGEVQFANGVDLPFTYQLVEADQLQSAHVGGNRNPNHFIPEAQPKERSDAASIAASDKIAASPDLNKVGEAPNAYSGAPIINERGEVIQGNNRSEGLKKHYASQGAAYRAQLVAQAEKYGLTKEQVRGMKNPVLVRRVAVPDAEAITLGNYDAKDIETGGKTRIDPVATSRRIPMEEKNQIVKALVSEDDTKTLKVAIKENFKRIFETLKKHLNPSQISAMLDKSGELTPKGVEDVEGLLTHFMFDKGDVALPDLFEGLPHKGREALLKSFPKIFSVSEENSLVPEIQGAITAHNDFATSGNPSFESWKIQPDIFRNNITPRELYSPIELRIAEAFSTKTQKAIQTEFGKYSELVNGQKADMFSPEMPGISKEEAIDQVFKNGKNEARKGPEANNAGGSGSPVRKAVRPEEAPAPEAGVAAKDVPEVIGGEAKPAESPVAEKKKFSIDGKDIFFHASDRPRIGRLRKNHAPQFGEAVYFTPRRDLAEGEFGNHVTEVELNIENPLYTNTKEHTAVENRAREMWREKELNYDPEERQWTYKKDGTKADGDFGEFGEDLSVNYLNEAAREMGYDAFVEPHSPAYGTEIAVLDESKIVYPEDKVIENKKAKEQAGQQPAPDAKEATPIDNAVADYEKILKLVGTKEREVELLKDKRDKLLSDKENVLDPKVRKEISDLDAKIEREEAMLKSRKNMLTRAERDMNSRANAKGLAAEIRAMKKVFKEDNNPDKPKRSGSSLFTDDNVKKIGYKLYNSALEVAARSMEQGNNAMIAIQHAVDHIADRKFTSWGEKEFRDELGSNLTNLTAEALREKKLTDIPLSAENIKAVGSLVEAIRSDKQSLPSVMTQLDNFPFTASTREKVKALLRMRVAEEVYKADGERNAKDHLKRAGGDYDIALKTMGDEYDVAAMNAATKEIRDNLRSKYAAAKSLLESKKTADAVSKGKITPVYHPEDVAATRPEFKFPEYEKDAQGNLTAKGKAQQARDLAKVNVRDRYARLETAQENSLAPVTPEMDALTAMRLKKSKASERIAQVRQYIGNMEYVKNSFYDRLKKSGIDINKLGNYMYALHAQERNQYNAETRQKVFDAKVYELNQKIADAEGKPMELKRLQKELNTVLEQKDSRYALMPDAGSGMTNQQAKDILDEVANDPKKAEMDAFVKEYRENVVDKILDTKYDAGQISEADYNHLKSYYKNYVPLKVRDELLDEEAALAGEDPNTLARSGIPGKDLYRSKGASYRDVLDRNNPIFQAAVDLETAIKSSENNRANNVLSNFMKMNPNEKVWEAVPAEYETVKDANGNIVKAYEDPATKPVSNENQTVIPMHQDGKKVYLVLKDKGLMKMAEVVGDNGAVRVLNAASHLVASVNTINNPEFLLKNISYDQQDAYLSLLSNENPEIVKKFRSYNPAKVMKDVISGKLDAKWAEWIQDWKDHGGEISFIKSLRPEEHAEMSSKTFENYDKKLTKQQANKLLNKLGDISSGIEQTTRVMAYRAAVEGEAVRIAEAEGIPFDEAVAKVNRDKAAVISRDATVDFDKKGVWAPYIGAWKAFANASIQAGTNMAKIMKTSKGRRFLGAMAISGLVEAEMNRMLGDCDDEASEDCYLGQPEDKKLKNIMIPLKPFGGHGFATIPVGRYFGWFNYTGKKVDELMHGEIDPVEFTTKTISSLVDMYDPTGGVAPVLQKAAGNFAPVVGAITNESHFGGPITPKEKAGEFDSDKAFEKTPQEFKDAAKFLHDFTGGNADKEGLIEWSPAMMQYAMQSTFGGVGNFIGGTYNTIKNAAEGKAYDPNSAPLMRVLFKNGNASRVRDEVNKIVEKSEKKALSDADFEKLTKDLELLIQHGHRSEENVAKLMKYVKLQQASVNKERNKRIQAGQETEDETPAE